MRNKIYTEGDCKYSPFTSLFFNRGNFKRKYKKAFCLKNARQKLFTLPLATELLKPLPLIQATKFITAPKEFYLTGTKTINFFPIPERPTKYTVITVDDIEELSLDDNSLLNTDFDNFLIEYANIRLSIGNEYEVSQEQQVMANIYSQIHSKF